MATQIQRRRGTTAQHSTFTGALGELTVDTDKKTVVVHDGATPGGFPLATSANITNAVQGPASATNNAVALYDGTTGKLIKNSSVTVSGSTITGDVTGSAGSATNLSGGAAGSIPMQSAAGTTTMYTGQFAGMRNKIINGKMEVSQRGVNFTGVASNAYTLDRWQWLSVGTGTINIAQDSSVPSNNEFQKSLGITVVTSDAAIAVGDAYVIRQPVEGYNARDLIGRTFTVSFWVKSAKTGTHCVTIGNDGGDRSYVTTYTINAINTWEYKTVTVTGGLITAGTWNWTNGRGLILAFTLAAGSTFQTTANAWQTGNFLATSGQVNVMDTTNNVFAITGVQVEIGTVATAFEHRIFGTELAHCQRYLPAWVGTGIIGPSATYGSTSTTCILAHPVQTRTAPTGVAAASTAHYETYGISGGNVAITGITFNSAGVNSSRVQFSVASGLTAGQGTFVASINSSAILFLTGCEL